MRNAGLEEAQAGIKIARRNINNLRSADDTTLMAESESLSIVSDSLRPHGLYSPCNSLSKNTGVGSLSLLQGIFPTQGSDPGLPHCRWILYQLSHKGSPRILEWDLPDPGIELGSPTLQADPLPTELSRKPLWQKVKVSQLCLTLCDPMDYTVHVIL